MLEVSRIEGGGMTLDDDKRVGGGNISMGGASGSTSSWMKEDAGGSNV